MPKSTRKTSPLFLLIVLAALGVGLAFLPGKVIEHYETARGLGSIWGYAYLVTVGSGLLLLASITLWTILRLLRRTRNKRLRGVQQAKNPSQLSAAERQRELEDNLKVVADFHDDEVVSEELRAQLRPLVQRIEEKRESQRLEIVAFGTISSGKSSLLNALAGRDVFATDAVGGTTLRRNEIPWPGNDKVSLVDTPGLGEVDGADHYVEAADAAKDADLVLLVMDGPLRDSEFDLLKHLGRMEKRILVCLNKEDWYTLEDQRKLVSQIAEQVIEHVTTEDVIAVRSRATKRPRVRVLPGGAETDEMVDVFPDIGPLADRMLKIVRRDGQDLLLANLLLRSRGLVDEAKKRVQESLDRKAWQIVDKYMWSAGGAAALSPFPFVDLAAGCAISSKMVFDLAHVYRQEIDAEIAVNLMGQQGKNLLAVLGSSVATPAIASGVASLLKTVPGVGTITGGVLQGIVQALVTRWIGAIFISYFGDDMREPRGGMAALARREWERITTVNELRKLVRVARQKLTEDDDE